MEEICKDRASFDAWCAKFAQDCKEEADDDGNNSGSERESDAELVQMGREVARRDPEPPLARRAGALPARWPGRASAVAAVLLAGACLAALVGPASAQQAGPAGRAGGSTAGGRAAGEQPAPGSPQLRGSAEAAVGATGVGSAAVLEEGVGEGVKALAREQTSTSVDEVESLPDDTLGKVTAGGTTIGSLDKEPAAMDSVPKDSSAIAVASEYDQLLLKAGRGPRAVEEAAFGIERGAA